MKFIGDDVYDTILKLQIEKAKHIDKDYKLILELLNALMGLKGNYKYKRLCECKNIKDTVFDGKKFKKTLLSYSLKIKDTLGYEIDEKNKASTEFKKILKKINYKLKYNTKSNCYSVVLN